MARRCRARYCGPLHVEAEIVRLRDVAERLVCTPWAQECIRLIGDALLRHGTLTGRRNRRHDRRQCLKADDRDAPIRML
jgi:hypothetical protein